MIDTIIQGDRVKVEIKGFNYSFWGTVTQIGRDYLHVKKDSTPYPISEHIDRRHIVEVLKDNMKSDYVKVSDLGNGIIKTSIPYFHINTYIHFDYFQSYVDMYKDYYLGTMKENK